MESTALKQQLEGRLASLKTELDKGQARMRQLEAEMTSLRETMLRISGAIMVLQEILSPPAPTTFSNTNEHAEINSQTAPPFSAGTD